MSAAARMSRPRAGSTGRLIREAGSSVGEEARVLGRRQLSPPTRAEHGVRQEDPPADVREHQPLAPTPGVLSRLRVRCRREPLVQEAEIAAPQGVRPAVTANAISTVATTGRRRRAPRAAATAIRARRRGKPEQARERRSERYPRAPTMPATSGSLFDPGRVWMTRARRRTTLSRAPRSRALRETMPGGYRDPAPSRRRAMPVATVAMATRTAATAQSRSRLSTRTTAPTSNAPSSTSCPRRRAQRSCWRRP